MAICDWPADERPREKLLNKGSAALSDAELLAIFLRTGCRGKSAVDLARELLNKFGGLRPLLESNQQNFCSAMGLGQAKYAQLQAVLEMSKRHIKSRLDAQLLMSTSQDVKDYITAHLRHRSSEVFAVMFLDSQHQLIAFEVLFYGTLDGAAVYPREVVKRALLCNAGAVILAHNHPSGIAEPSQADQDITHTLKRALATVEINVLDHIIVGNGHTTSLAERGMV